MSVKDLINFIGSRGITTGDQLDSFFLYWLNWISLLTSLGAFSLFFSTFIFEIDGPVNFYRFITSLVGIFYMLIVILHHYNQLVIAFFHFALVVPLWYAIAIAFIGGNFSQSIAAASTLVVILFIYPQRDKVFFFLMIYNMLLFIVPTIYVNLFGPIIGIDFPYDEVVVFILCCGWVSIAFISFDRSRSSLIQSLKTNNSILNNRTAELHQFSYLMAHDIKTPIRNIVSFLGLLERALNANDVEKAQNHLEFALKGSKDLTSLVEDVSKVIELRGQDDTRETHNLDKILETTLFNLESEISQYNGVVNFEAMGDFICKSTDMTLLFQNIIMNGLKYNKSSQPTVNIKSEQKPDTKLICFSDNGIGIEQEYQDKIFDFFQRLHVKSDYEGTGIGLGICNYIVGKYNGQIHVESTIGNGSTFIVELPC